jgi:uncharacterized protein involved in outer membrane biogenesis
VKRLLIILGLLAVLPGLLISAVFLVLKSMDPEFLRSQLEAALENASGRQVTISGPLQVTLRPLPSVTLNQVTIANARWARAPNMLSVRRLSIRPSLRRLVIGQVVLHKIEIEGAQLWLENSLDGRPSWAMQGKDQDPGDAPEIRLQSIDVTHLRASYFDAQDGTTRSVSLDRMTLVASQPEVPVRIAIQGQIMDLPLSISGVIGTPDQIQRGEPFSFNLDSGLGQTRLAVEGRVLDLDFRDYSGLEASFEASGERPVVLMSWTDLAIPRMDRFQVSGRLTGDGDRLGLDQLDASLGDEAYDMQITGRVADLTRLSGMGLDFSSSGVSPASFLPRLRGSWLATERYTANGRLEGSLTDLKLTNLKVEAGIKATELKVDGTIGDLAGSGDLDVIFGVQGQDMASVSSYFELPVPDVDELDGTLRVTGSWEEMQFDDVRARLREGSISGWLSGSIGRLPDLDGLELRLEAEGRDLRDLTSLLGVEGLIRTDRLKTSLILSGHVDDLSLRIDTVDLARDDLRMSAKGWLQALTNVPRLDLKVDLTGKNLRAVDYFQDITVPGTDRFQASGRLRGLASAPDLQDLEAEAELGGIVARVRGRLPDVLNSRRFQLSGVIEGDDLSRLGHIYGQDWPMTRSFSLRTRGSGAWESPQLDDIQGSLILPEGEMKISGRIGDLLQPRDVYLDVQATAESLVPLLPWGGRAWERLGQATASFTLSGGPDSYEMEIEHLGAGNTKLQGRFNANWVDGRLGRLRGSLVDSTLDLGPWMDEGPDAGESPARSPGRTGAALIFPDTPLPTGWLKGRDFDIGLTGLEIMLVNSRLRVVRGLMEVQREAMTIEPFTLQFGQDEITGRIRLDAGSQPVSLKAELRSVDFNLGDFLRRVGFSAEAEGHVDLLLDLDTDGDSPRDMANNADGRFAMLLRDGRIGQRFRNLGAISALTSLLPWSTSEGANSVHCFMADFPLGAGVANAHLLILDTDDMLMRGEGEIDLGRERIDLLLRPRPKRGRALSHNVNIRVVGPLRGPRYKLATGDTAVKAAGAVGRFAVLGPLGLFVSTDSFRSNRQECAESLEEVSRVK